MPAFRPTKQATKGIPFAASHDISYQHKLASLADSRIGVFSAAALAAASASKQAEHASHQPRTPSPEGREGIGADIPAARSSRPVADEEAIDNELSMEESRHLQDQMVQEGMQQLVVLRAEMAGIEATLQLMKGVSLLPFRASSSLAFTPVCAARTCRQMHQDHEQKNLQAINNGTAAEAAIWQLAAIQQASRLLQ